MTIIRGPRPDSKFVTVDKCISEDTRLSWAARGLLVFLLGKPDHWRVSVAHLMTQTEGAIGNRSGRDAVRGLLSELQQAGYVRAVPAPRDAAGRMKGLDYVVSEQPSAPAPAAGQGGADAEGAPLPSPAPGLPGPALPAPGLPGPANPHLVNTEYLAKTEDTAKTEVKQSRTRQRRPLSLLPADFAPTAAAAQYASAHGLHLPTELANFKKKAAEEAWQSASWAGSFATWLRKCVEFRSRNAVQRRAPKAVGLAGGAAPSASKNYSEGINDDGSF